MGAPRSASGPWRLARWLLASLLLLALGPAQAGARFPLEGRGNDRWFSLELRLGTLRYSHQGQAVRILQLGDSHTAGVFFPVRLAERLHRDFGYAGTGILPPGYLDKQPAILAGVSQTAQWSVQQVHRRATAGGAGGAAGSPVGLGGLVGSGSSPYQMVTYEFPRNVGLKRFVVYSDGQGQGGVPFRLYDGTREVPLAAEAGGDPGKRIRSVFQLRGTEERLTLVSRADAQQSRLLGVSAQTSLSGVMFSRIGMNGATFAALGEWDSEPVHAQLQDYAPDLLILAFGTNDVVNNASFTPEKFRQSLQRTADWISHHVPNAAILLVTPPHAPKHGEATNANLKAARTLMRQIADERGWRVWDWSRLTAARCDPQCRVDSGEAMFQPDGIHLTRKGYEATGDAIAEAIAAGAR